MAVVWTRGSKAGAVAGDTCGARDCAAVATAACRYLDQWGWRCAETFCPGHGLELGGDPYCRRHAGLFLTLGGSLALLDCEMDDIFARRPSLVSWVPRDLDLDVRNLLAGVTDIRRYDPSIVTEQLIHAVAPEAATWEVRWQVATSYPKVSISFLLEGFRDPALSASVDGKVVIRETPDWLRRHLDNEPLDGLTEEALRHDLFSRIGAAIAEVTNPSHDAIINLPGYSFQVMSRGDLRAC